MVVMLCMFLSVSAVFALTPEESLKKNFPTVSFDTISPSNIPGLYEVTAGRQIFYYAPDAESIVVGRIITKDGRYLTDEKFQAMELKRLAVIAKKLKDVQLDKALKIGSGKNTIIEITDPDCSFCRQTAKFFSGRTDTTRYIFFFPLPMNKNSGPKVRNILCAENKVQAYEDAMTGKLDDVKLKRCDSSDVEALVKIHKETALALEVAGTPFFIINGQPVEGANIPLIEKLLGGGK
jgi:thiol:disulfide interchange protein DsbC